MQNTAIVKIRASKGNRYISIPKKIADLLQADYLRVVFANGQLVYIPIITGDTN